MNTVRYTTRDNLHQVLFALLKQGHTQLTPEKEQLCRTILRDEVGDMFPPLQEPAPPMCILATAPMITSVIQHLGTEPKNAPNIQIVHDPLNGYGVSVIS